MMRHLKIFEEWSGDTEVKSTGKYTDWNVTDLEARRNKLKAKDSRTEDESTELRQINFAIRAKTKWGKVKKD